jgi:cytochrome c5
MDWQHRFGGVLQFPIIMKLILAGALLVLVCLALVLGRQNDVRSLRHLVAYALCALTVSFIGYFGGEIVYGKKSVEIIVSAGLAGEGAVVFEKRCAACHFTDKTDNKIGPGLKGLFKKRKMVYSGLPVSDTNIRTQLKKPFRNMPAFADLPQDKMDALIEYLKTL